jgi:hypothetical protein
VWKQGVLLEHVANAPLSRRQVDDRFARHTLEEDRIIEANLPAIRRRETRDRLERLSFAGAGRTEEHQDFCFRCEAHLQGCLSQAFDDINGELRSHTLLSASSARLYCGAGSS